MPSHPFCDLKGFVREHRLIMDEWLRASNPEHPCLIAINGIKYINRGWVVHHKNEYKLDNRISNLDVLTNPEHSRVHSNKRWERENKAYRETEDERRKISYEMFRKTIEGEFE